MDFNRFVVFVSPIFVRDSHSVMIDTNYIAGRAIIFQIAVFICAKDVRTLYVFNLPFMVKRTKHVRD